MFIDRAMFTSPEMLGMRRMPTSATLYHFASEVEARKVKKEFSPCVTPLDGMWKFSYTTSPEKLEPSIVSPRLDISNWDDVEVPDCWVMRGVDYPHYTNILMPFEAPIPDVPEVNPTGIYRRTFEFTKTAKRTSAILHFDGAESFFLVYVNGKFAGCSKDSRGSTEFDVTDLVKNGTNHLAVIVVKWSDATWIEDQDHWYLPGLSRSVYLYTVPEKRVRDAFFKTTLDDSYSTGILDIQLSVSVPDAERKCPNVTVRVYDPAGTPVWQGKPEAFVRFYGDSDWNYQTTDPENVVFQIHAELPGVQKWSAETPNLYTATVEYKSSSGTFRDAVGLRFGFKRIECRNRKMLVNGQAVLICGVNRHDHHETKGKVVPFETMKRDVELMKQFNINAVRTSHYPSAPEFYELCDEYGLYVIDEANIEHHARYNELCRDPRFAPAFIDRVVRMFERDKNHACVYAWSLGNESGANANQAAMAGYLRFRDNTRLVHYEGALRVFGTGYIDWAKNQPSTMLTDIIPPMYPEIERLEEWSRNNYDDRPLIMCEYSHAMGNSNGSLADYFKAFESIPGVQGGYIWEWLDHGIAQTDANGKKYWAYGGDFGDKPNDINFCTDGLIWPDRTPHPGLYEYKYLAQPVRTTLCGKNSHSIEIFNRRYFKDLSDLELRWSCECDGKTVSSGVLANIECGARAKVIITLPVDTGVTPAGSRVFLKVSYHQKSDTLWEKAGFAVGWESFELAPVKCCAAKERKEVASTVKSAPDQAVMTAGDLSAVISADGLKQLLCGGKELVKRGPRVSIWRAAIDNDGLKLRPEQNWKSLYTWLENGYDRLRVTPDRFGMRNETAECHAVGIAKGIPDDDFEFAQEFSMRKDGILEYTATFVVPEKFVDLPRLGVTLELPKELFNIDYFGNGPFENYNDRCAAAKMGMYKTTPQEMYVPYIMPQENGCRTGVEFISFRNSDGNGLLIAAPGGVQFSALPYSVLDLWESKHTCDLNEGESIYLNIDLFQRGLGTGSCGPMTRKEYRVYPGRYKFTLLFGAVSKDEDTAELARAVLNV